MRPSLLIWEGCAVVTSPGSEESGEHRRAAPQGGSLVVKGEGSYVFEDDKRFTSTVVSTFAIPNQPSTAFSVTKTAEYVGPCPN